MTREELAECVVACRADTVMARAFRRAFGLPMPEGCGSTRAYRRDPTRREVLDCMMQRHGADAGLMGYGE